MEVEVNTEQCMSRIKHMPHYWRLDGKTVVPQDLQRGHRFLAMCHGRASDLPTTLSAVLLRIIRARADYGSYPNCALFMCESTVDKLIDILRVPPNNKVVTTYTPVGIFNAIQRLTEIDIVTDNALREGQYELRTVRGENPDIVVAKGPVFAHGS